MAFQATNGVNRRIDLAGGMNDAIITHKSALALTFAGMQTTASKQATPDLWRAGRLAGMAFNRLNIPRFCRGIFTDLFSRQDRGIANAGDVLIGLSTSGNSQKVIEAVLAVKQCDCTTIAMAGRDGGKLTPLCDNRLVVPSDETPLFLEMHIMMGHILCDMLEDIER